MRKIPGVLQVIVAAMISWSCRPEVVCEHKVIPFTNRSAGTVYYYYANVTKQADWEEQLDISMEDIKTSGWASAGDSQYYRVRPGATDSKILVALYSCWTDIFKAEDKYAGIFVYVFDSATAYSQPWDSVVAHRAYSRLYKINYDTIVGMNWEVEYR